MHKSIYLVLAALVLSSCGQQNVVKIAPLSSAERTVLRANLLKQVKLSPEDVTAQNDKSPADACAAFVAALPKGFVSGTVEVPENWNEPKGKKIKVFYYGRTSVKNKNAAPVVFYNGGPGSDSHSSYELLEDLEQAKDHPFVYIDQRGNGCSDLFPLDLNDETLERLTHYGTRNIVLDSEAVRKKLFGSRKWKAFGQSYGGYIVHRYVTVAPESLAGAYAHGSSLMDDGVEWLKLRIMSQHRVVQDYFAKYPGDKAKIKILRDSLNATDCYSDDLSEVCGASVVDASTILLGFQSTWTYLNQWLGAIVPETKVVNKNALQSFVRQFVFGIYLQPNIFAGNVISKLEMLPGYSDNEACALVMESLRKDGTDPDNWDINECRLLGGYKTASDVFVKKLKKTDPQPLSELRNTLLDRPDLKMYLYSGQKDVFVPVETFKTESDLVGSLLTYRHFLDSGHEGFYTEQQVWDDLKNDL